MSILVNGDTKVICQGITGSFGASHTKACLDYGTQMVGGVTPGKGGQTDDNGLPIFDTVADAVTATGASATMIFVPPAFSADALSRPTRPRRRGARAARSSARPLKVSPRRTGSVSGLFWATIRVRWSSARTARA